MFYAVLSVLLCSMGLIPIPNCFNYRGFIVLLLSGPQLHCCLFSEFDSKKEKERNSLLFHSLSCFEMGGSVINHGAGYRDISCLWHGGFGAAWETHCWSCQYVVRKVSLSFLGSITMYPHSRDQQQVLIASGRTLRVENAASESKHNIPSITCMPQSPYIQPRPLCLSTMLRQWLI